jgi:hypothetical protein
MGIEGESEGKTGYSEERHTVLHELGMREAKQIARS